MSAPPDRPILIVDDEPAIRALLRTTLRSAGWHTVEAADGIQALDLAARAHPALVLLDLALPRMDGLEVCRRLRADARTARTPLLLITGLAAEADERAARAAGAQGLLTKPFRPAELEAKIRRALA
jgi:CheY-like chemotaxis protein